MVGALGGWGESLGLMKAIDDGNGLSRCLKVRNREVRGERWLSIGR